VETIEPLRQERDPEAMESVRALKAEEVVLIFRWLVSEDSGTLGP